MKFRYAKITNSRLMGSMGLIISWDKDEHIYNQYFLLDAEGLGIADYISLENVDEHKFYMEQERLMGGLGSDRIYISKEDALFLVNQFGNKTIMYNKELPGEVAEYAYIIEEYKSYITFEDIFPKICKLIENDIEFINYMTMRFIARDREALRYFCVNEDIANMHITNINGVLLKNKVISKENNKYICETIYEDNDGYYKCKLAFNIDIIDSEYKIRSLIVVDKQYVDHVYVLDEMIKNEYIVVYNINDQNDFLENFYSDNPFTLKSNLENGVLFTRFNFNNNHVKKDTYLISDDIKSLYYIINNKLLVACYNERNKIYTDKILNAKYKDYIKNENEYLFKGSVLYEFVESEENDFYNFIDKNL
jgi:hypothetical protein